MKRTLSFLLLLAFTASVTQAAHKFPRKAPRHIVMVGFDGMSAQSVREGTTMPFYHTLMERGSYTLHRRSVLPSSSACNWASLYMGAGPEQHGYNAWDSRQPNFPSDTLTADGFFPDIFFLLRQAQPEAKLAQFYEWIGLHFVVDSLALDVNQQFNHTNESFDRVLRYIREEQPLMVSIIFNDPDHTGHDMGWMSPEYLAMEGEMDRCLRRIYEAVEQAGMLEETLFILTADHGGIDKHHGGTTLEELETCLVFCGKGVRKGHVIEETASVCDVAPTIAQRMGLRRPHAWVGRPFSTLWAK